MKWIKEHRLISISLCVLLVIGIVISTSYFLEGNSTPVGKAAKTVVYAVERPLSAAGNSLKYAFRGIFEFRSVLSENEALKEENAELRKELVEASLKKQDLEELQNLSEVLNYDFVEGTNDLVTCDIIAMDSTSYFGVFTINKGSDSGIYKDAVVVSGDGLVGTVYEVGSSWSKVMTIVDDAQKVSFRVFRDLSILGILQGDGNGTLNGYMLDSEATVIEGDLLITSNIGIYPEGIEIGKVISVEYDKDTQLKTVEIEPSADLKNLQKVTVII